MKGQSGRRNRGREAGREGGREADRQAGKGTTLRPRNARKSIIREC